MSRPLTRDDVFLSEPRRLYIPGIVRRTLTVVTVAGHRFEMMTFKSWLFRHHLTKVYPAGEALVEQGGTDIEQVIAALLDVLNGQTGT